MSIFYGNTEEEAIAKGIAAGGVGFRGDESCNDYEGDCSWDGVSRRCACGNRRVEWDTAELIDGRWRAYAEAW
jgi:hypothetical protein